MMPGPNTSRCMKLPQTPIDRHLGDAVFNLKNHLKKILVAVQLLVLTLLFTNHETIVFMLEVRFMKTLRGPLDKAITSAIPIYNLRTLKPV